MRNPIGSFCLYFIVLSIGSCQQSTADDWKSHPALRPPDGKRHRGDPMVAGDIDDIRVLEELSRRFKMTRDPEYFLRLLDYYLFSKNRLVGLSLLEI